jgi:hypothetical protein
LILTPTNDAGAAVVFRPKVEYKLFTVDEWAKMANILIDYEWLWYYGAKLELKSTLLEKTGTIQAAQVNQCQSHLAATESRLESMSGLLDREQKTALKKARRASVELWLWRSLSVVAICAAGGFGIAYGLNK